MSFFTLFMGLVLYTDEVQQPEYAWVAYFLSLTIVIINIAYLIYIWKHILPVGFLQSTSSD